MVFHTTSSLIPHLAPGLSRFLGLRWLQYTISTEDLRWVSNRRLRSTVLRTQLHAFPLDIGPLKDTSISPVVQVKNVRSFWTHILHWHSTSSSVCKFYLWNIPKKLTISPLHSLLPCLFKLSMIRCTTIILSKYSLCFLSFFFLFVLLGFKLRASTC